MKFRLIFISKSTLFFAFVSVVLIFRLPVIGQLKFDGEQNKLSPPSEEKFTDVNAVASPWRVGSCPDRFYKIPNCHEVGGVELYKLTHTNIYNEDGSLWYNYSNQQNDPDFYKKNKTMDFLPFAGYGDFARNAILRMVGESNHWYKVEVNEQTQATKFILKIEPEWEKTSWDFWLAKIQIFSVKEGDKIEIRAKPDGEIIGRSPETKISHFRYLGKTDGDWAYIQVSKNGQLCYPVELKSNECYPGWIRWREGRNFLVKSGNLLFTINDVKSEAETSLQ